MSDSVTDYDDQFVHVVSLSATGGASDDRGMSASEASQSVRTGVCQTV